MTKLEATLKKLAKQHPELNSTQLALLYAGGYPKGYGTPVYYAAMVVINKHKLGFNNK